MKRCFKCKQEKPVDEFYKHPRMADGRLGKCKECTKRDVQQNYRRTFPERQRYERERFANPDRREAVKQYDRRMRQKYPHKYAARAAVSYAVRTGAIKRLPCEVCGDVRSHAHHEDYSKPLEVKWLCSTHHHKAHGHLQHLD